jgi:uroporphyrinogen decarboxylase
MLSSRERIINALEFKTNDRIPMLEIGFWRETITRWRKEGLDANAIHIYADNGASFYSVNGKPVFDTIPDYTVDDYFGLDRTFIFDFNCSLMLNQQLLEDADDYTIIRDENGITLKVFKDRTAPPAVLGNLIKDKNNWADYYSRLYQSDARFDSHLLKLNKTASDQGFFCVLSPLETCWFAMNLLGEENFLIKTALEPGFLRSIFESQTEFQLEMIESMLGRGFIIDALWYFSDLCYKNGMLFSPAFYTEIIMPYHKKIFDFCRQRNIKIIYHSDGNITKLLPLLIESGIDCIQPLEARQGNNVIKLKKEYGDTVSFMGNINVDELAMTQQRIYEEVCPKIMTAKENGGYLFHSDHSIPPSVSFENYTYTVEIAAKTGSYS